MRLDWESSTAIADNIELLSEDQKLNAGFLYCVKSILSGAFGLIDYKQTKNLFDKVPLTEYGKNCIDKFLGENNYPSKIAGFIALSIVYHRDFLIDINNIDEEYILSELDYIIKNNIVLLPERHGRKLYNRFNNLHPGKRLDFLEYQEAIELLQDSENGVFQVGPLLVGPLGAMLVEEARYLPPKKNIPLWHCSDPGCGAVHTVELLSHPSSIVAVFKEASSFFERKFGVASDWEFPVSQSIRDYDEREYNDLMPVLHDAFSYNEKKTLFKMLLEGQNGKYIRQIISDRLGVSASRGNAENVVSSLTEQKIMNFFGLVSNLDIKHIIDTSIYDDKIVIPTSEIRRSKTLVVMRDRDLKTSVSSLGIRSNIDDPAVYLSQLIHFAYRKVELEDELAWKCGVTEATDSAVLQYISEQGPDTSIQKLIMSSMQVFDLITNFLEMPNISIKSDMIVDKMLWKCGFNVARYENSLTLFRESLISLKEAALQAPPRMTDKDRELIRSSCANTFVYAENFLENLVCYNAWYLNSDHFILPAQFYLKNIAMGGAGSLLSQIATEPAEWKSGGGNTLGPLLVHARSLAKWMDGLSQAPKGQLQRDPSSFPHFSEAGDPRFPFPYVPMWANLEQGYLSNYAKIFSSIVTMIEQSKVAYVRNGIQHYRDPSKFPSIDEIIACEARLSSALDSADAGRFIPKSYWLKSASTTDSGITTYIMEDYKGRTLPLIAPYALTALIKPSFGTAYLIPHSGAFGPSEPNIIFIATEESDYFNKWSRYPIMN